MLLVKKIKCHSEIPKDLKFKQTDPLVPQDDKKPLTMTE